MYSEKLINREEFKVFDDFIEHHPYGNFLQKTAWYQVKKDVFTAKHFLVYKQENIVGACQMLFRKAFGKYTIAYIPRGFVCDYSNQELVKYMIDTSMKYAKENHAINLVIEPYVKRDAFPYLVDLFKKTGFIHSGYEVIISEYQPRIDMKVNIDLTIDEYYASLKNKEKNRLKNAMNQGLTLINGNRDDFDKYIELSKMTEERNAITLRSKQYYKRIYDAFLSSNQIDFVLVKFDKEVFNQDINKRINDTEKQIEKVKVKLEKYPNNQKFINSYQDLNQVKQSLLNRQEAALNTNEEYLAGAIVLYSGKEATYLYAASSNKLRFLDPSIFMNYHLIEKAIQKGCTTYNMGGIHSLDAKDGLYLFKSQMNAIPYEYEGYFTIKLLPILDALLNFALSIKNKLRKLRK